MHIFPPEMQHVTEKLPSVLTENNFIWGEQSPKIADLQAHNTCCELVDWLFLLKGVGVDFRNEVQYKSGLLLSLTDVILVNSIYHQIFLRHPWTGIKAP